MGSGTKNKPTFISRMNDCLSFFRCKMLLASFDLQFYSLVNKISFFILWLSILNHLNESYISSKLLIWYYSMSSGAHLLMDLSTKISILLIQRIWSKISLVRSGMNKKERECIKSYWFAIFHMNIIQSYLIQCLGNW